jgi:uncharacterized membrane protein YdjX (TVP38/TMEM64 family)
VITRTIALVAIVGGFVIVSKLLIENVLGFDLEPWARSWMAAAGPAGAATVIGLLAADVFVPIPSSVIMILSGAAFGVWWGSLLAFAGSMSGEWLGFEIARRYGSAWASRFIGDEREVARLNAMLARHGAAAVAVTRPLPVVMETMSLVAGVSTMKRRTFLWASAIGTAPIVVIYAYAGAMSRDTGSLIPAIVILIAVGGAGLAWYRATRPAPSSEASRD